MYIKGNGLPTLPTPLDFTYVSFSAIAELYESKFEKILDLNNISKYPSQKEMLFDGLPHKLRESNRTIVPVLDRRYQMMFLHHFTSASQQEINSAREALKRQIPVLLKALKDKNNHFTFLYCYDKKLNQIIKSNFDIDASFETDWITRFGEYLKYTGVISYEIKRLRNV